MKFYNYYAFIVHGKWKIYQAKTYRNLTNPDKLYAVRLESDTRYLAKKELANRFVIAEHEGIEYRLEGD